MPVLLTIIALGFLADGYTDPFYLRLTGPVQNALIVGSSRAAQNIQPAILNAALRGEYRQQLYNFSFTYGRSPYGEAYLNAIRKKLNKDVKNSLFIVSVDPWSLGAFRKSPENPATFTERNSFLEDTSWINTTPNFSYLLKCYPNPYFTLLTGKIHREILNYHPPQFLNKDGWLDISWPMDSLSIKHRNQLSIEMYRYNIDSMSVSNLRKSYLCKTIRFFQQHGDVYLVRMPVHPDLLVLENQFYPGSDKAMDSIARQQHIPYFNFMDSCSKYIYTDQSHLWKESGAIVTKQLAALIIKYRHSR